MISLAVHAELGLTVIGWIVASNPKIFARPAGGGPFSALECGYYLVGIVSIALGWYFNARFVFALPAAGPRRRDRLLPRPGAAATALNRAPG